jgi:hypothetical protein
MSNVMALTTISAFQSAVPGTDTSFFELHARAQVDVNNNKHQKRIVKKYFYCIIELVQTREPSFGIVHEQANKILRCPLITTSLHLRHVCQRTYPPQPKRQHQ